MKLDSFTAAGCFSAGGGKERLVAQVTVTVHKIIVSNDPNDELSSARNIIASMH